VFRKEVTIVEPELSIYEKIGGEETIRKIVKIFYTHVQVHPELKHLFPDDLTETMNKQYLFLSQFFGGPPLYTEKRGHPRLRARHLPFSIYPRTAEAWLACMKLALDEVGIEKQIREEMWSRFVMTAYHMINQDDTSSNFSS
jgi:hemoglobin